MTGIHVNTIEYPFILINIKKENNAFRKQKSYTHLTSKKYISGLVEISLKILMNSLLSILPRSSPCFPCSNS